MRIPIYKPMIGAAEVLAVARCVKSGWISHRGPAVAAFEAAFAKTVGAKFAVAVSSGTAALHCALVAAGVKPGDEVIVPALTYVATANAVVHAGATPVFADVDAETWCITPKTVETAELYQSKQDIAAFIPVSLYGHPVAPYVSTVPIVEDCAEALGSTHPGGADASAWSFFANKTITTGEGGMVTTNSEEVADSARRLSHQGLVPGTEYQHDRVGYNYRMTGMQAALGLAQLKRLPGILKKKRMIASWYREGLRELPIKLQADHPGHSWWLVSMTIEESVSSFRGKLSEAGIETRSVFPPVCCLKAYSKDHCMEGVSNAHNIYYRGVSLPSFPALTRAEVDFICRTIRRFYE